MFGYIYKTTNLINAGDKNTSIKLQPININRTVTYTCRYLFI